MNLAAEVSAEGRLITIILFTLMTAATLWVTVRAGRQTKSAADFHSGGRSFSGLQNGLAIGSDYMSAASFLGIAA